MNKALNRLKQLKRKAIGFDYEDEKECLKAVKANSFYIQFIKNPSEEVQLAAVKQHGRTVCHIKNPTDLVILTAVRNTEYAMAYVDLSIISEELAFQLLLIV